MRSLVPMLIAAALAATGYLVVAPGETVAQDACIPSHTWHAPACGHEHGDAPPQWIMDAGYTVAFDEHGGFHGNTGETENTIKHMAMKGFSATFGDQEVYVRTHIQSNVLDRSARYHSNEIWLRDAQGGVSHWQGWMNSGDPVPGYDPDTQTFSNAAGRRSKALADNNQRPIILVVDGDAAAKGQTCEQWYVTNSYEGWAPEYGWNVCGANTLYFPWENYAQDIEVFTCDYPQYGQAWQKPACQGSMRTLEFAWYGPGSTVSPNRGNPPKGVKFWATQFGERVSGPNDPKCASGQQTTRNGITAQNICLDQFVATTARAIENLSTVPNFNKATKQFPVPTDARRN